jgi:hypothetical protein
MPLGRWPLSVTPEKELADFLASKPAWLQRVLQQDLSSFTQSEMREWINRQDEVFELRKEFERILRDIPARWNEYCKAAEKNSEIANRHQAELIAPKPIRGAPQKADRAAEASALRARGKTFPQIATIQATKYGEQVSPDAIRKQVARFLARTKSKP